MQDNEPFPTVVQARAAYNCITDRLSCAWPASRTQPVSPHHPWCLSHPVLPQLQRSSCRFPSFYVLPVLLRPCLCFHPPSLLRLIHACLAVQVHEVELPSGATRVSLSARKPFTAVVSLQSGAPVIVELSDSPVLTALDTNINLKGG